MTKERAKELLAEAGFDVFEQRGFYSHFLRVRIIADDGRPVTVKTINITSRGNIQNFRAVTSLVALGPALAQSKAHP